MNEPTERPETKASTPTTRCKFRCTSLETFAGGNVKPRLDAVYPSEADGFKHSKEDHAFFEATPQGHLELLIQNPYGAELFEAGESYYIDISKAPK